MVRIIPWKLPDVMGGSVGGYTPKVDPTPPTPEPVTNYPYDLDNIVVSTEFETENYQAGPFYFTIVKGELNISGVVILDSMSVSSVIATVAVTPGTATWTGADETYQLIEANIDVDISSIMSNVGGSAEVSNKERSGRYYIDNFYAYSSSPYPTLTSNECTIELTSIKVYNSNGVVIQEWTPPEE